MERFYKDVTTGPDLAGGYAVLLDGRPVRTPEKETLSAPNAALAALIAAEWAAQDGAIKPDTMPLTQLLTTAIDRVKPNRDVITDQLLAYIDSDLLCYRAITPEGMGDEQAKLWDPWLAWFTTRFGGTLATTTDLIRLDQDKVIHETLRTHVDGLDLHQFTLLQVAASVCGSIVLGLAVCDGAISPEDGYACALCEELFHERIHDLERHGLDPVEEKRRNAIMDDLRACDTYRKALLA